MYFAQFPELRNTSNATSRKYNYAVGLIDDDISSYVSSLTNDLSRFLVSPIKRSTLDQFRTLVKHSWKAALTGEKKIAFHWLSEIENLDDYRRQHLPFEIELIKKGLLAGLHGNDIFEKSCISEPDTLSERSEFLINELIDWIIRRIEFVEGERNLVDYWIRFAFPQGRHGTIPSMTLSIPYSVSFWNKGLCICKFAYERRPTITGILGLCYYSSFKDNLENSGSSDSERATFINGDKSGLLASYYNSKSRKLIPQRGLLLNSSLSRPLTIYPNDTGFTLWHVDSSTTRSLTPISSKSAFPIISAGPHRLNSAYRTVHQLCALAGYSPVNKIEKLSGAFAASFGNTRGFNIPPFIEEVADAVFSLKHEYGYIIHDPCFFEKPKNSDALNAYLNYLDI